jgi:uncharacterized protein (TIGR02145 family)
MIPHLKIVPLFLFCLLFFLVSCKKPEGLPLSGTFIDQRDNRQYRYITIGSQIWMAENLAYLPAVSPFDSVSSIYKHYYVCGYDGFNVLEAKDTDFYKDYGVWYNWPAAMDGDFNSKHDIIGGQGACPPGWHLPGDQEWKILEEYLGMDWSESIKEGWRYSGNVGGKLKELGSNHWAVPNVGASDTFGFKALPAGSYDSIPSFCSLRNGEVAAFWTSTVYCTTRSMYRSLSYLDAGIGRHRYYYYGGRSIRCVKDF